MLTPCPSIPNKNKSYLKNWFRSPRKTCPFSTQILNSTQTHSLWTTSSRCVSLPVHIFVSIGLTSWWKFGPTPRMTASLWLISLGTNGWLGQGTGNMINKVVQRVNWCNTKMVSSLTFTYSQRRRMNWVIWLFNCCICCSMLFNCCMYHVHLQK